MRAALDYPPTIEYQNQISRQNRAQAWAITMLVRLAITRLSAS
jgi:hypothetical protein